MSEQEDRVSPHTSLMVAAGTGMTGLSSTSSTSPGSVLTSTTSPAVQTSSGTQRLGALESIAGELYGLSTPIFPPTTFDLPDISFSNSVNSSSNGGGNLFGFDRHGLFGDGSGGQLMGDLTISSHSAPQQQQHSSHHQQQLQVQQSLQQIQQQQQLRQQPGQFPMAACSPHGTSSSDDSDDLPLAQLAKRQAFPAPAVTSAPSNTLIPERSAGSQDNSPNSTTTASIATNTSTTVSTGTTTKKAKPTKRKKKKDPNEPQKPVSAYALFFRDTQATIKGHNPSASFGEVSKIVASMWDQLDPEHKDVYKKKTETAKKQYLKQLAAYRASQVSQSASDETEKSPSPPEGVAVSSSQMSLSPSQQSMGNSSFSAGPVVSPPHMGPPLEAHQHQIQQQQLQHQQMMQMSPQHQMMQQQQQMMHQQMQQQQQMQHMQQQQMMTMNNPGTPSPPQHQQQQLSPLQHQQQQHLSPPQQHLSPPQQHISPPQHVPQQNDSRNIYNDLMEQPRHEMDLGYPHCVRVGCTNQAKENPAWDSQYCSNDCVITHCRDIFTTWVSSRSGSNSFPVK